MASCVTDSEEDKAGAVLTGCRAGMVGEHSPQGLVQMQYHGAPSITNRGPRSCRFLRGCAQKNGVKAARSAEMARNCSEFIQKSIRDGSSLLHPRTSEATISRDYRVAGTWKSKRLEELMSLGHRQALFIPKGWQSLWVTVQVIKP